MIPLLIFAVIAIAGYAVATRTRTAESAPPDTDEPVVAPGLPVPGEPIQGPVRPAPVPVRPEFPRPSPPFESKAIFKVDDRVVRIADPDIVFIVVRVDEKEGQEPIYLIREPGGFSIKVRESDIRAFVEDNASLLPAPSLPFIPEPQPDPEPIVRPPPRPAPPPTPDPNAPLFAMGQEVCFGSSKGIIRSIPASGRGGRGRYNVRYTSPPKKVGRTVSVPESALTAC